MTQPAQMLNGIALGEKMIAFYTAYQGHVFQFASLADSPIDVSPISKARRSAFPRWPAGKTPIYAQL